MYESKDNVEKEKLITTVSLLTQNHRFLLKQINIKKKWSEDFKKHLCNTTTRFLSSVKILGDYLKLFFFKKKDVYERD